MNKTIDNDYRIIPIKLAKAVSNKEIYSYLSLAFKSDFKTGKSNVLLETLSEMTGYDAETVSSHLHGIAELGFIKIESKPCGEKKIKNFYTLELPTEDFIMVSRSLLDMHLNGLDLKTETNIKGFLVLVKSICINNTNVTLYSLRNMAKHLNLSYATIQKLMRKCLDLNLICKENKAYKIMVDCFDKGNAYKYPKGILPLYKATYESIREFCAEMGFIAPPYKKEHIAKIATHFPITDKELQETGDQQLIQRYSLKSRMAERIPSMKEPVNSLNYFVKVLTNELVKPEPPKKKHVFIMD